MEKKQQAQRLYMDGGKTQKEIAETVGVSERTIHSWVHQYSWHKLRLATLQAPVTIAGNLCSQLVELQNTIAAREPGKRYPTMEEAEITRKLIVALEKMKKYPSLSQSMQVLETFRNYMRPINKEFAGDLARYAGRFLTAESMNGFAPYQVEYGASPASPFYSEPDKEDEEPVRKPCTSVYSCPDSSKCKYPDCRRPDPLPDPQIRYAVPDICYPSVAPAQERPVETPTDKDLPYPSPGTHSAPRSPSENAGEMPAPAHKDLPHPLSVHTPPPAPATAQSTSLPSGESRDSENHLPAPATAQSTSFPLGEGRDGATTGSNPATFQSGTAEKSDALNRQQIKNEAIALVLRSRSELPRSAYNSTGFKLDDDEEDDDL